MLTKNKNSKLQPIFKKGRFFNPNEINHGTFYEKIYLIYSFFHEIYIFFKSLINSSNRNPKTANNWVETNSKVVESSIEPIVTWIGHATFLIQIGGINILTDPIFGNATIFFPRIFAAGIELNKLPRIDYVLISHNHMDHMDYKSLLSLSKMNPNIKFLIPHGNMKWFEKHLINNSIEFEWWQNLKSDGNLDSIQFTFLPAQHWSQRNLFDCNKTLWGSWMIVFNGFKIYFAGDTAYSDHFSEISKEFSNIDIAIMPIGPCEPREKMCRSHIGSEEAGKSFLELNAKHFIPMHWGTFHFGTDLFDTPIIRLKNWWQENNQALKDKTLNLVKIGQQVQFPLSVSLDSIQVSKSISSETQL